MKRYLVITGLSLCSLWLNGPIIKAEEPFKEEQIEEIVITGTRLEQLLEKATQSISIITAEDIANSPARTLEDVLEKEVGINFVTDYGARGAKKEISLRGSSKEEVLVLVDGRRINSPQGGWYDIANFPLESIERIEILRGPASSLYGADALGGVINIITKKPTAEPKTSTSFSAGEFDTQLASLTHSHQIDKLGYFFSTSKETSDGFRDNSYLNQENYTLRLLHKEFDFKVSSLDKEIGIPGAPGGAAWGDPWDDKYWTEAKTPNDWLKDKETRFDLGHTISLSNLGQLKTMLFYNHYRKDYFGWGSLSIHKNYNLGLATQLGAIPLNDEHSLLVGMEYFRDRVDSTDIERHRTRRWAGFLQEQFTPSETLTLILSGRYDKHLVYGGEFSPKASGSYLLKESTKLRASVGKGYRAPALDDLYWPEGLDGCKGDKDLKPETSWEYEVGVTHKFSPSISSDLVVFQRNLRNAIKWEVNPSSSLYEPRNIGKARFRGGELKTTLKVVKYTTLKVNYSYLNTRDRVKHTYIKYEPQHLINSNLVFDLPWQDIAISLDSRIVKKYVPHTEECRKWTHRHWITGLKIRKDFKLPNESKGSIFLGIENLFNRKYMVKQFYPMPPRTILGGLEFRF